MLVLDKNVFQNIVFCNRIYFAFLNLINVKIYKLTIMFTKLNIYSYKYNIITYIVGTHI